MAPTPKRVLGVDVPPIPADPVPPPRARTGTLTGFPPAPPSTPVPPRSFSPPGNVKFSGPGGVSFSGPGGIFLMAFLVASVLAGVVYFVRGEIAKLEAKLDAKELRDAARYEATQRQFSELKLESQGSRERDRHNTELMAAVLNKLGSNLRFHDGTKPQAEFHPAPLSPRGAPVQPRDTLLTP